MSTVRECKSADEWDEYILENGGHPLQLWGWGELKGRHGWRADRLFVEEGGTVIAGYQVLTKRLPLPFRAFSYVPRATLFHVKQSDTLDAAATYMKQTRKSVALSVEPDTLTFDKPAGWVRATNKILPAETVLLDLNKDEADLQAAMAKKTRQYIRKSGQDVVIQTVTDRDEVMKCLDIYQKTAQRAGFALHDTSYYLDVLETMKDHAPLFAAYVDNEPVAFLWLAISGETAYELYGGMNDIGQKLRANYALKWHAIQKTKSWGLTKYDFGGIVAGGVATFKAGWTDESTHFAGTYDKPLSPLYVLWSHALPFAKKAAQKARKLIKK